MDDETFQALTSSLPTDRFVTAFMAFEPEIFESVPGPVTTPTEGAISVSLRRDGIHLDAVSTMPDGFPRDSMTDPELLSRLDDPTLGFVQTVGVAEMWTTLEQTIESLDDSIGQQMQDGIAQFRADAANEIGVDPIDDLVLLLDGPTTIAATYSETSSVYRETEVPVGLVAAFGTSSPGELATTVELARVWAVRQGLSPLTERDGVYVAEDGGIELFAVGLVDRWLTLATSAEQATALSAPASAPLTSTPGYQEALAALGGPVDSVQAYVDLATIFERFIEDTETLEALSPLRSVIVGSSVTDNLLVGSAVLVVETAGE